MSIRRSWRGKRKNEEDLPDLAPSRPRRPGAGRGRREEDPSLPDLVPGARRLSGTGHERPRGLPGARQAHAPAPDPAMRDALVQAVRLVRRAGPPDAEGLAALEQVAESARRHSEFESLGRQLREVRAHSPGQEEQASWFGRVVAGVESLARVFGQHGAAHDLASIAHGPPHKTAVRALLASLERVVGAATEGRAAAALMRECVSELIEALARLGDGELDHRNRLDEIRRRLVTTDEVHDLEELRQLLVMHATSLVDAATTRESAVREALDVAKASQARAEELEAALTDERTQARTDPLTGLGNRRALTELVSAVEPDHDTGVLVIDLDHFKRVNDRYGHSAGDTVLRQVARLLRSELRGDDQAFRVGGEEVVVLLPEVSWQGMRVTAERLRSRLARAPISLGAGAEVAVTMSIGLSLWSSGTRFEDALSTADEALYRAKDSGRNRVVG
ncbi:MAG: GGDEF domain-containing protein [Sandaracinaceae bacterium]